ncbi:licodione synthase-like [Hibiscus syriacus]|uniref:Licodione synthase-like n=1 Tax=Hibiscus syriacus TaxID=106335 RepID=A0A6A2YAA9_HIBSY|nr:licodione synthase-like [Hibiscus syriacus]
MVLKLKTDYMTKTDNTRFQPFQALVPEEQPYRTALHFQPPKNWLNDHALIPSETFNAISCWSGSATILPGDKSIILYTGIDANYSQVQNLATPKSPSDPLLIEWVKYSGNPLMTPSNGVNGDNFRDPTIDWQGPDGTWKGLDTELEKFLPDADFSGTSLELRIDYGEFYASKTFEGTPRQIWLDRTEKQLVQWPVEELTSLRDNQVHLNGKQLKSGSLFEISAITASQADIEMMFELPELEEAEFMDTTLETKDLTERTTIFFRIFRGDNGYVVLMCNEQKRSSLRDNLDKTTYGAFVDIDPRREMISLRTLIYHSIIENFGEGRTCITARVYPKLAINDGAHLFAFNYGTLSVTISSLHAWSMNRDRKAMTDTVSKDFLRNK